MHAQDSLHRTSWTLNGQECVCHYRWSSDEVLTVEIEGHQFEFHCAAQAPWSVRMAPVADQYHLLVGTQEYWAAPLSSARSSLQPDHPTAIQSPPLGSNWEKHLQAPMPGKITSILPLAQQAVEQGTVLLVMEAMKMEHFIAAPMNGIVEKFYVALGEQVQMGQLLVEFCPQ